MPYSEIDFMGISEAQQLAGRSDTIVISIASSGDKPARLSQGFRDVLRLQFDNVESLSGRHIRFSKQHADEIIGFVKRHEAEASRIVVHCMMGESRSAAIAEHLASRYSLPLTRSCAKRSDWIAHVLRRVEEFSKLRRAELQS